MLSLETTLWMMFIVAFGLWAVGFVFGTTKIKVWLGLGGTWFLLLPVLVASKQTGIALPSVMLIDIDYPTTDIVGLGRMIEAMFSVVILSLIGSVVYLLYTRFSNKASKEAINKEKD